MLINLEILQKIVKMANKLPNPRDLVLNKETKVSNGVYGRKADKRTPPKMYFEIHEEEID